VTMLLIWKLVFFGSRPNRFMELTTRIIFRIVCHMPNSTTCPYLVALCYQY